jgi:hypothetical protein
MSTPTKKKKAPQSPGKPNSPRIGSPRATVVSKPLPAIEGSFAVSIIPLPADPKTRPHPLRVIFNPDDVTFHNLKSGDLLLVNAAGGDVTVCLSDIDGRNMQAVSKDTALFRRNINSYVAESESFS